MNRKIELLISFDSSDSIALIKSISNTIEPFNRRLPTLVTDGFDKYTETQNWIDELIPKYERSIKAYWGYRRTGEYQEGFISYRIKEKIVKIQINDYELIDAQSVLRMLAPLPWTVASIFDFHSDDDNWDNYIAPGFAAFHFQHGWACAFKAEGHKHLVSRCWLEYHPWYLIRDEEHDISFVQFHDLDADPATALEQAIPGHRAMSMYGIGGYIGKTHPFSNDLRGIYLPDERNLRVVIPAGKEVTYSEMSDYCAARHFQAFSEGDIDLLSFVFIVAEEAQPYIHDLWLRNIEVFGFTPKGEEIRLDENYHPTYEPPQWVKREKQAEQQNEIEEKKLELAQVEKKIESLNQRIKNSSGGVLTGELNQNEALISRTKELELELRKQRVVKQNLEKEITNLENSNSKEFT